MQDPDELIGEVLASRYRIEAHLGGGAMGNVYRARHVKVGRPFAVKVLHSHLLGDPKVLRRFEREAELAGTLHHPNVVCVVDVGEQDRVRYLVLEYADGKTLAELIGEGPMPARRVIDLARELCDGLHHAHERGLIHRDFKPENVIVERDPFTGNETIRILDFGIAILREDAARADRGRRITTDGLVLGTPHYLAPEYAADSPVIDHRIDLFALGVTCFEMLTGKLPFDGDGVDVARANIMMDTPPMGVRAPYLDVDPLLEVFTRKLMSKSPDARPPTAKAARDLLDVIDRDRNAAADLFGVHLPSEHLAAPRIHPPRIHTPRRHTEPRAFATTAVSARIAIVPPTTERIRSPRRIAYAAVATFALAGLVAFTMRPGSDITPPAEPAMAATPTEVREVIIPPKVAAAAAPAIAPAPSIAPVPAPPPPPPAAAPPIPKRTQRTTQPARPRAPAPPPPTTDVSAQQVAQLYAAVARDIKALDDATGTTQQDFWQRYRLVRINEVIGSPERRRAAVELLSVLRRDIAARAK